MQYVRLTRRSTAAAASAPAARSTRSTVKSASRPKAAATEARTTARVVAGSTARSATHDEGPRVLNNNYVKIHKRER